MRQYKSDIRLGDLITRAGIVPQAELKSVMDRARDNNEHLGQILIKEGHLAPSGLRALIAAQAAVRDASCDVFMAVRAVKTCIKTNCTFESAVKAAKVTTNKLGELLVEAGILSQEKLDSSIAASNESGLPLGRVLLTRREISESVLEAALELQVRVRDGMTKRSKAVEILSMLADPNGPAKSWSEYLNLVAAARKHVVRLGELLVRAGISTPGEILDAQEKALVSGEKLGQVLIAQDIIPERVLEAALALQQMVDNKFLKPDQAANCLGLVYERGFSFTEALVELGLARRRRFMSTAELDQIDASIFTTSQQEALKTEGTQNAPKKNVGVSTTQMLRIDVPSSESSDAARTSADQSLEGSAAKIGERSEKADGLIRSVEDSREPIEPIETPAGVRPFTSENTQKGDFSAVMTVGCVRLARAYFKRGEYSQAAPLYRQALSSRRPAPPGFVDSITIEIMHELSTTLNLLGKREQAEKLLLRCLNLLDNAFETDQLLLATTLHYLGLIYLAEGNYFVAEPFISRALTIRESRLPSGDELLSETMKDLARLLNATDRQPEAEQVYARACAIMPFRQNGTLR